VRAGAGADAHGDHRDVVGREHELGVKGPDGDLRRRRRLRVHVDPQSREALARRRVRDPPLEVGGELGGVEHRQAAAKPFEVTAGLERASVDHQQRLEHAERDVGLGRRGEIDLRVWPRQGEQILAPSELARASGAATCKAAWPVSR